MSEGIRFIEVTIVLILQWTVDKLSKEEGLQRTMASRRAHWGRRVPAGVTLGNLRASRINVTRKQFPATAELTRTEEWYSCTINIRYISPRSSKEKQQRELYAIHLAPWHTSHVLIGEYPTVLICSGHSSQMKVESQYLPPSRTASATGGSGRWRCPYITRH